MPNVIRGGNSLFSISFEDNLADVKDQLEAASRWAVPYAASTALSKTAYDAAQAEKAVIARVFDRPNALTQGAVLYKKATKDNLTYTVYVRDEVHNGTAPQKYLEAQILGGARRAKPFELRLRSVGVLGTSQFAVPASGAKLDRFGNLPASVISQIISQLGARRNVGVSQNTTATSKKRSRGRGTAEYFVPDPNSSLPRGVYQRGPLHSVKAVLIFVSAVPTYRKLYPFGDAAIETAAKVFGPYWVEAFNKLTAADLKRH